mgnify:CR=1 FL=1
MIKILEIAVKVFATGIAFIGLFYFTIVSLVLWDADYFVTAVELVDQIWED